MNDCHLFSVAEECSRNADYCGGNKPQIGCVIAYHGTILAKGHNTDKTHTDQAHYNKWRYKNKGNNYLPEKMHAETSVLRRIKYLDIDFSKAHIYVYRQLKDGSLAMARPCPSCMAAIKALHIKHVHYSTPDGYAHEILK